MELKDLITLIGIISALILGIVNLIYIVKNRRNSIREHIYKEQIANTYEIFRVLSKVNQEIDSLINNPEKKYNNDIEKLQNEAADLIYSLEFILSNSFLKVSKETLDAITKFYLEYSSSDEERPFEVYGQYFITYYKMVKQVREQFGIEALSNENEALHKLPANNKKLIRDLAKEIGKPMIENILNKM